MQFLANRFNFKFATSQAKADQYSPFFKHIDDIQNKRSKLFPDRRKIPGRKTKFALAIAFVVHAYFLMKLKHSKTILGIKSQEQADIQRKIIPYFQALDTIQYTILKHRYDLMVKQVLGEQFLKKNHFHNTKITWVPMNKDSYGWIRSGLDRYHGSPLRHLSNRHGNGFQMQNI